MPDLGDVANDVLARLDSIKSNTDIIISETTAIKADADAIKTNTTTLITEVSHLDADVQTGFTNLAQGVQVLIALGQQADQLLADNNKQNETIICWLTNIANTLCDIKHNTDKEVQLQTAIARTLHHMDAIGDLVHAREAVEVATSFALEAKIAECCPPKQDPPRPCFEKCASPKVADVHPIKVDWKPVTFKTPDRPK